MLHVIAIGGGELRTGETRVLDEHIVRATRRPRPAALFLPTASADSLGYWETFQRVYGGLGCRARPLFLVRESPSDDALRAAIEGAHLIYVGGGNCKRMLDVWRTRGVDRLLVRAAKRGAVVAGLSAGAMCWFRFGNSDAPVIEGHAAPGRKTLRVDGLGLVDAALCPHMSSEPYRWEEFPEMMRTTPGVGLGLDDGVAIEIVGARYRILAAAGGVAAHRVFWRGGALRRERVEPGGGLRALKELVRVEARGET